MDEHDEEHKMTPLMWAAARGQVSSLEALLEAGAKVDVTATDGGGHTALMYAARNGHAPVVTRLLAAGAKVDAKQEQGLTSLS